MLASLIFAFILITGITLFLFNCNRIRKAIKLGRKGTYKNSSKRFKKMLFIAFGQSKMVRKPIAGILHIFVYLGFIIINIEVLEIIFDGLFGTHRIASKILGNSYNFLIGSFEFLALLVFMSVSFFWIRRVLLKIPRFVKKEMQGFPKKDALYILYFEMVLMLLFLVMNAADQNLQEFSAVENNPYIKAGYFPISQYLAPLFQGLSFTSIQFIERTSWWLHIVGILAFLNYLYYSKHLHIILAFPTVYFSRLEAKGKLSNLTSITKEIKLMLNQDIEPDTSEAPIETFGAKDVSDLSRFQLLSAYSCTECGRCTDSCPASNTGKKLSPRAIMMKTRDRLEELVKDNFSQKTQDNSLLYHYITPEEIWACTTCNACVEECPIEINPLSIIMDLRRYLIMEKSEAPLELNTMMSSIENNGAPWPYNQNDRINWNN